MGYSIMVQFPRAETRDQILKFLIEHMTPIHHLTDEDDSHVRGPTSDVSYGRRNAAVVGFDFSLSGDLQSRVAFRICYWMMRQVPNTKFWYDGTESWPIPKICDEHGFEPMATMEINMLERSKAAGRSFVILYMHKKFIKYFSKFDDPVKNELTRLTTEWNHGCI